jgi:hypothetical protein
MHPSSATNRLRENDFRAIVVADPKPKIFMEWLFWALLSHYFRGDTQLEDISEATLKTDYVDY